MSNCMYSVKKGVNLILFLRCITMGLFPMLTYAFCTKNKEKIIILCLKKGTFWEN